MNPQIIKGLLFIGFFYILMPPTNQPFMDNLQPTNLLDSSNVDVSINPAFGSNCMYFKFKGTFTSEAAEEAIRIWTEEFESNPSKKFSHLWDCDEMEKFEMEAKRKWMNALAQHNDQIDHICIVASSIVIRGAARIMSNFTKLKLRIFKSLEELEKSYTVTN